MDKYLLEILKLVNTIIIPGLGALTITNKETEEIMFMSYLKHDDGKLAEYIAEKEGWDLNDAKNLISKYVSCFLDFTHFKIVLSNSSFLPSTSSFLISFWEP